MIKVKAPQHLKTPRAHFFVTSLLLTLGAPVSTVSSCRARRARPILTTSSLPRCADAIIPSAKPLFKAACAAARLNGLGASSRCTTTELSRFFFFFGRGAAFVAAMAPPRFFFLACGARTPSRHDRDSHEAR